MKDSAAALIRRLAVRSACWFTVLSVALIIPCLIAGDNDLLVVHPLRMLLLLPMAVCFAGAGLVRLSGLKSAVRALLHALLCIGGFFVCGYLPFWIENKSGSLQVVLILLFALLVWVIGFIIYLFTGARRSRKQTDRQEYTDKYRKH